MYWDINVFYYTAIREVSNYTPSVAWGTNHSRNAIVADSSNNPASNKVLSDSRRLSNWIAANTNITYKWFQQQQHNQQLYHMRHNEMCSLVWHWQHQGSMLCLAYTPETSITASVFHSKFETHLFHRSFLPVFWFPQNTELNSDQSYHQWLVHLSFF